MQISAVTGVCGFGALVQTFITDEQNRMNLFLFLDHVQA